MANAAKEYATALFSTLESKEEKLSTLTFLRGLTKAITENSSFVEKLMSKTISQEQTKEIFSELVDKNCPQPMLKNFFNLLVEKRRVAVLPQIEKEFEAVMDKENNVVRGVVKSALLISPEKREELEVKFSQKLNKKVILEYKKDESVVAGVRVEVEAYTFDDTFETHIKNIKENLNRSWS